MTWKHEGRLIRKEIRTSADPAIAFRAWAEPDKLEQFFVDAAADEDPHRQQRADEPSLPPASHTAQLTPFSDRPHANLR